MGAGGQDGGSRQLRGKPGSGVRMETQVAVGRLVQREEVVVLF
jgi:hypothetical protein